MAVNGKQLRLEDRDLEILYLAGVAGVIQLPHIHRWLQLHPPKNDRLNPGGQWGEQATRRRVRELYRPPGYLRQLPNPQRLIGEPDVFHDRHPPYAITNKGAEELARRRHIVVTPTTVKSQVPHALGIADFVTACLEVCHPPEAPCFLALHDILLHAPQAETMTEPGTFRTWIQHNGKRRTYKYTPDLLFGFTAGDDRAHFALEWDRGTMSGEPTSLWWSAILWKLLALDFVYRHRMAAAMYGMESFRALFVARTEDRANNMVELYRKYDDLGLIEAPAGFFRFTHRDLLLDEHGFLPGWQDAWRDGLGRQQPII